MKLNDLKMIAKDHGTTVNALFSSFMRKCLSEEEHEDEISD